MIQKPQNHHEKVCWQTRFFIYWEMIQEIKVHTPKISG